jgi:hypothetical protein
LAQRSGSSEQNWAHDQTHIGIAFETFGVTQLIFLFGPTSFIGLLKNTIRA